MTGQDAVNTAKAFNDRLDFSGVVLTKLDGEQEAEQLFPQIHRKQTDQIYEQWRKDGYAGCVLSRKGWLSVFLVWETLPAL